MLTNRVLGFATVLYKNANQPCTVSITTCFDTLEISKSCFVKHGKPAPVHTFLMAQTSKGRSFQPALGQPSPCT